MTTWTPRILRTLLPLLVCAGVGTASIEESFDWGPDYEGRGSLSPGDSVESLPLPDGSGNWAGPLGNSPPALLGGRPGEGNGLLDLGSRDGKVLRNTAFGLPISGTDGSWEINARVRLAGSDGGPAAGFYLGVHENPPDKNLLPNIKSDHLVLHIRESGEFTLSAAVAGRRFSQSGSVSYRPGSAMDVRLSWSAETRKGSAAVSTDADSEIVSIERPPLPVTARFSANGIGLAKLELDDLSLNGVTPLDGPEGWVIPTELQADPVLRLRYSLGDDGQNGGTLAIFVPRGTWNHRLPAVVVFRDNSGPADGKAREACRLLAEQGIIGVVVYQAGDRIPGEISDWLTRNADELGIDPDRLIVGSGEPLD